MRFHFFAFTCILLLLSGPLVAQQAPEPTSVVVASSEKTIADRAFEFKSIPVELRVYRKNASGVEESLAITRVPELLVGDRIQIKVDLDQAEFQSKNRRERERLRDWSIAWFLASDEGTLLFDSPKAGSGKDRGRIDLYEGQTEDWIVVEHERQKFPIFFFVRTRTLESWEYIRKTRETKASNFVDYFGSYSDAVNHYEDLQVFLSSLQREGPGAETVEERLQEGFKVLGFTVDTQMKMDEPETVAKLLSELDRNFLKDGKTFRAEVAGRALSQMIAESDLGLIGAAVQIGTFLYSFSDYKETYHWSSARLKEMAEGRYMVMSSERLRHGESEAGPGGAMRDNVRSILVCTPVPTIRPQKPNFRWKVEGSRLIPGTREEIPELRVGANRLSTGTHPSLVERFTLPDTRVWDSVHGDDSPLKASMNSRGEIVIDHLDSLWQKGNLEAQVRVEGHWGFEPVEVLEFKALKSPLDPEISLQRASHILTKDQKLRLDLHLKRPTALGKAIFRGKSVALEPSLDPNMEGLRYSLLLDLTGAALGPASLELYAGQQINEHNRLLRRDFQVVPAAEFQVVLPAHSKRCELVTGSPLLTEALSDVKSVRVAGHHFEREGESSFFSSRSLPSLEELKKDQFKADLLFKDPTKESVRDVFVQYEKAPEGVQFLFFASPETATVAHRVVLDSANTSLLASGSEAEFRLIAPTHWRGDSSVELCIETPMFSDLCSLYRVSPERASSGLEIKQNLMYGTFRPGRAGSIRCTVTSGLENSQLKMNWQVSSPWRVVDVPQIRRVKKHGSRVVMEGRDLDILISRVYASPDPAVDSEGSELVRRQDGSYETLSEELNPEDFWIELRDLLDEDQRIQVRARP